MRLAKNSKPTAYAYASQLFVYWRTTLAKRFKSLEEWAFTLELTIAGADVSVTRPVSNPNFFEIEGDASGWINQLALQIRTPVCLGCNQRAGLTPCTVAQ